MGHSFVSSANAIPNYLKDLSLLLSSSDWLWLHRLLPTEMPSDCIWKCCAVNVITFLSALPCQWISSLFFSKIMSMVQILLHLSKSGKGLCHLPLRLGKGSSEVQTTCKSWHTIWPGTFVAKIQARQPRPFRPINLLWITEHRVKLSTCLWQVGSFLLGDQALQQLVLLLQMRQCFKPQKPQVGQI